MGTEVAHVTCDSDTSFKGRQKVNLFFADVLDSQHAGKGAIWRINTKILSTCRGRRHGGRPPTACCNNIVWLNTPQGNAAKDLRVLERW